MKPSIVLRLIVSLVVIVAFVIGATVAEASNSLNPTALWWAQRQSHLLWIVDGFALFALLPVFGSAVLQTRLANRSEEMTRLRDQHETQIEDMIQHAEDVERINNHQSESLESLEATVEALSARLAAMEADTKAHQKNMEAEARRLAGEAFAALAGEVQANTRQMEAVSLAMQYQRAEIKQLRQSVRATQHSYEITEVARLTPYELAALEGNAPPLMLEGKEEEERQGTEEIRDTRYEIREEKDSSFILHPSSLQEPSTTSAGFFEPTMNAGTTFVSPTTEFEITPPFETKADIELPLAESEESDTQEELPSEQVAEHPDDADNAVASAPSETAVTSEEYRFLHGSPEDAATFPENVEPSRVSQETHSTEAELQQDNAPRGLRRWFMRL